MNLHSMKNVRGARHRTKRLGCGEASGHGKTCGRGTKGQYARSGHKFKPTFEGGQMRLVRRIPKRGFNQARGSRLFPVNLDDLARLPAGAEVTVESLRKAGVVSGPVDGIKILGSGDVAKGVKVSAHAFSASAKAKIEAAGGSCTIIS